MKPDLERIDRSVREPAAQAPTPHLQRIVAAMEVIATLAGDHTLTWEDIVESCKGIARAEAALKQGAILLYGENVVGGSYIIDRETIEFQAIGVHDDLLIIDVRNSYSGRLLRRIQAIATADIIDGVNVLGIPLKGAGVTQVRVCRLPASIITIWILYVHALARLDNPSELDLTVLDQWRDMAIKYAAW